MYRVDTRDKLQTKGTHMDMNVAAKAVIGVGIVGAVAAGIAYAVTRETDPKAKALDDFVRFDRNGDGNISNQEATRLDIGRPYARERQVIYRNGDWVSWRQDIIHNETTSSMQRAWLGAKGNDAIASVDELVRLVDGFDKDGNGKLSFGERGDFNDVYGVERSTKTILDNTQFGTSYEPIPRP